VILLSLGWLCARRSRARFHMHRSAQGHDCVATSVHLDMEAAPLQGHPLGHRSALEPGVSRQGHWGVGAPTFLKQLQVIIIIRYLHSFVRSKVPSFVRTKVRFCEDSRS